VAQASDRTGRTQAAGPTELPPSMRDRVPFLLFRASQASLSLANQMLAEIALCARQVGILTMVTELEPMTQKALADALRIDRTTMVALLDDLEAKGYVARQRHPRDRRAFLVHPTGPGRTRTTRRPAQAAPPAATPGQVIPRPGGQTAARQVPSSGRHCLYRQRRVHGSETARPGRLIVPGGQYQIMISTVSRPARTAGSASASCRDWASEPVR